MNRVRFIILLVAATLIANPHCVRAGYVFYSNGSDINVFTNSHSGVGNGGTAESAAPFVINGVAQGSYIAATDCSLAFLSSPVTASAPGIWAGFLMQATAPNSWAGGICFFGETSFVNQWVQETTFAGLAGWWGNSLQIGLGDPNYSTSSEYYSVADGQSVAVLAHFYDTGGSGTFNTGDLYVDPNLADGINFGAPTVSGFTFGAAVTTIGALRLGADPSGSGETRYYDNIVVATSQTEALGFLETGTASVPEPSSLVLLLTGLTVCGGYVWRKKKQTA
jgi:hypothetical protein